MAFERNVRIFECEEMYWCDLARKWLGDGELVRFNNLFPSQFHDLAYRILLERDDLFSDDVNSIVRYTYE